MKLLNPTFIVVLVAFTLLSCNTHVSEDTKSTNLVSEGVHVYYFHNTTRCVTCLAVEKETKMVLEVFYSDEMKEGDIEFIALNLEEQNGKEIAELFKVAGQALLLVKGDAQVNLINEGFMNARTNPEKFHEILKTQIEKLL